MSRRLVVLLAWALWRWPRSAWPPPGWSPAAPGRPPDAGLACGRRKNCPLLVPAFSAATVGAVLAAAGPATRVGWLLLRPGPVIAVAGLATSYASYGLLAPGRSSRPPTPAPGSPTPASSPRWRLSRLHPAARPPPGRCRRPRWRWWAGSRPAGCAGPASSALPALAPPDQSGPDTANPFGIPRWAGRWRSSRALVVTGLACWSAAGSLVLRFRRARGVRAPAAALGRSRARWPRWPCLALARAGPDRRPTLLFRAGCWRSGAGPAAAWRSGSRSCGIGCMTWTISSAARWCMGC